MAKRTVTRRFNTDKVQGKGTYVILSSLTIGERRAHGKASKKDDYDQTEYHVDLLTKHIREWNWVGEDGKALALPKDDPKVIDTITDPETVRLMDCLTNPDAKN